MCNPAKNSGELRWLWLEIPTQLNETLDCELGSGVLLHRKCATWCHECRLYSYVVRDNVFCCRDSVGQVILPPSSYDSSLDRSEMFPPLHFLPLLSLTLLAFLIPPPPSLHPTPPPALPLSLSKPFEMRITSRAQFTFSLCSDSIPLFYSATVCFTPNEVEQHTDRQLSQIRHWEAEVEERGRRGRGEGEDKRWGRWGLKKYSAQTPHLTDQYTSQMVQLKNHHKVMLL